MSLPMNGMPVAKSVSDWPPCGPTTVYDYGFCVWPDEECRRWTKAAFELFRMLNVRVTMEFTERSFSDFREELAKMGLALREVERVPHLEPAPVH